MKRISLLVAACGLLASMGNFDVASAKTALETLQDSAPPPRHRCPDPGEPVAQAIPSDLNAPSGTPSEDSCPRRVFSGARTAVPNDVLGEQIWVGLYNKAEKLGGLTIKEIDPNSRKTLAEHKFVASPSEKKVYLYDDQYRLASRGLTATFCTTDQAGKKPNYGKRTVTSADGRSVETQFTKNKNQPSSETNVGITSKWRQDPEIVQFFQAEKQFWIRHAGDLRDEATEAEVEYAAQR